MGVSLTRHLTLALTTLALFALTLLGVLYVPALSAWDAALVDACQTLRHQQLDSALVAITMLGDGVFASASMAIMVLGLLLFRQWWLGVYLSVVGLAANLSVPIIKLLTGRNRPQSLGGGLDSFSFPSGHATAATTLFGIAAVLLISQSPPRYRWWLVALAFVFICLVASSRVYLAVHWPSDVFAGILLGGTFVVAFAYQWVLAERPIRHKGFAILIVVGLLLAYTVHLYRAHSSELNRYQPMPDSAALLSTAASSAVLTAYQSKPKAF